MPDQTVEQLRAKHALAAINLLKSREHYKYVSYVKALPAAILMNGLGQALATELSAAKGKSADAHKLLYDHVHAWLCSDCPDSPYRGCGDLIEAIVDNDEDKYLLAQIEALAYLVWLKKFAVAFLEEQEED